MTPAERLRAGEVLILDTDTLPGLHAAALLPASGRALRLLKGAPDRRPFLLLFASVEQVFRYGSCADPSQIELLRRFWPGPLTAILTPTELAVPDWCGPDGGLAVRVPDAPGLLSIIEECGSPLYSTSANRSGEEPARDLEEARLRFPELVAHATGDSLSGQASTLVDLREDTATILRAGACGWPPTRPGSSP